jgi:hypothetical protein
MKHIEYIDLPSVPAHLLESVQDIINKPTRTDSSSYAFFKTRYIEGELKSWLQSIFDWKIDPQYQLVYNGIPIHRDANDRVAAYNYLLDTGGDNVITSVYDDNQQKLQSEKLELKRWHYIDTGMLHTVYGIHSNRVRVAITIGSNVPRR